MDIKKNYKLKKKFSSAWNRICKSASNYKSAFKNKLSLNNMADFKEKYALKGMSVFADGIKRSLDKSSTRAKKEMGIFLLSTVIVCTLVGTNLGDINLSNKSIRQANVGNVSKSHSAEKHEKLKNGGVKAWVIRIDDKQVVAMATKKEAKKTLRGVRSYYYNRIDKNADITEKKFKEKIEIKNEKVDSDKVMSAEKGFFHIVNGGKEIKTYLIKAGDTAWDIAVNNHVTFTDMKAINPGFDPFNIKIGEKIKLTAANPFLTLQTKEISNYSVSLPFGVSEHQTDALYKGERQVYAAGQPGIKNITSEIVRENGKPVSSRELVSKVTSEPVKQIVLTGTKNRPDFLYAASTKGKLGRPMASLRVSCAFGASRGSRRHEGIDFCTPVGTSVYASEGGVVTKAAREGSYGNVIFIKHGNGLETRYAHCSKLLVSAGQSVQRGQMIAKSGNTGRSTGPHLHFEVRVGKTATNPIGYL